MTLVVVLLMLILISSFVAMAQNRALNTARVLGKLAREHQLSLDTQSLSTLLRPVIGEASLLYQAKEPSPWSLQSEPFEVEFRGEFVQVKMQDTGGVPDLLRSPMPVLTRFLPGISEPDLRRLHHYAKNHAIYSKAQAWAALGLTESGLATVRGSAKLNLSVLAEPLKVKANGLTRFETRYAGVEIVEVIIGR